MESTDVLFQVLDWYTTDYLPSECDEDDDSDDSGGRQDASDKRYLIKMFGMDMAGKTYSVNVTDFKPYFFVQLPRAINANEFNVIYDAMSRYHKWIYDIKIVRRKQFWGFTNNEMFPFLKFRFNNLQGLKMVEKFFSQPVRFRGFASTKWKLYESNVEPFLRFIHKQSILPCGWVKLPSGKYKSDTNVLPTTCKMNLSVKWNAVEGVESTDTAPFHICSFDLECTSSHGDFPVPKKDYTKTARELYDMYRAKVEAKTPPMQLRQLIQDGVMSVLGAGVPGVVSHVYTKKRGWGEAELHKIEERVAAHMAEIMDILKGNILYQADMEGGYDASKPDETSSEAEAGGESDDERKAFMAHFRKDGDGEEKASVSQDNILQHLTTRLNSLMPELQGDPIVQIGCVMQRYGSMPHVKTIFTLGDCADIPGVEVVPCATERDMLLKWGRWIRKHDPDILTGYNIFGFDMVYVKDRAEELGCWDKLAMSVGRFKDKPSEFVVKKLASSALGDNELKFINMEGRVLIDLMKVVQRDHRLDSYKLDFVAQTFMVGEVKAVDGSWLTVNTIYGLQEGNYISLGSGQKVEIAELDVAGKRVRVAGSVDLKAKEERTWGLAKDDVTPKQIFAAYPSGTMTTEEEAAKAEARAVIARYCIQDCALCNHIIMKLQTMANNMGMANVCLVPLSYIFMRGQGIKVFSLVSKQCDVDAFAMPTIRAKDDEEDESYEGAIVLDPIPGIYVDEPINVMDYASLYPSSMISENISHDSIVLNPKYDNLPGCEYVDITFDVNDSTGASTKKVCRYAQFPNNEKGVIPRILQKLLAQRKATRKKMEEEVVTLVSGEVYQGMVKEVGEAELEVLVSATKDKVVVQKENIASRKDAYDDFQKAVLDGLQLAYKVTANSVYGQVGARTSPICMKDLAASTTATGRSLILKAKAFMEERYKAKVVYGDTDSVMLSVFPYVAEKYGQLQGKELLAKSIEVAMEASKVFQKECLKPPHDLEYEKTFFPFVIFTKKRYIAMKYEHDVNKCKLTYMGIALKRRDYAKVTKEIYSGVLNIIMKEYDIKKSLDFLNVSLNKLVDGKYDLGMLTISKTLKGFYKNPRQICHKVLADRMRDRDPGSAPQANDRVPYVYVPPPPQTGKTTKKLLQGDLIEHPNYIKEHNITPDYGFYISNQIMNPIIQLYALMISDLRNYVKNASHKPVDYWTNLEAKLRADGLDSKSIIKKMTVWKEEEAKRLLFQPFLIKLDNKKQGMKPISSYFTTTALLPTPSSSVLPTPSETRSPSPIPFQTKPIAKKATAKNTKVATAKKGVAKEVKVI